MGPWDTWTWHLTRYLKRIIQTRHNNVKALRQNNTRNEWEKKRRRRRKKDEEEEEERREKNSSNNKQTIAYIVHWVAQRISAPKCSLLCLVVRCCDVAYTICCCAFVIFFFVFISPLLSVFAVRAWCTFLQLRISGYIEKRQFDVKRVEDLIMHGITASLGVRSRFKFKSTININSNSSNRKNSARYLSLVNSIFIFQWNAQTIHTFYWVQFYHSVFFKLMCWTLFSLSLPLVRFSVCFILHRYSRFPSCFLSIV